MVLLTMIARVADGLPLAASMQEDEQVGPRAFRGRAGGGGGPAQCVRGGRPSRTLAPVPHKPSPHELPPHRPGGSYLSFARLVVVGVGTALCSSSLA